MNPVRVPLTFPRWTAPVLVAALIGVTIAAYWPGMTGPFVLDDQASIVNNATLRHLWPPDWLRPPIDAGVGGRPLANLSFAANYAAGGLGVRGYHLANLAIHLAAGLLLFGVVRRTLLLPRLRACHGPAATTIAALVALLWSLHPLQTEAVTYVSQRTESAMAAFYLGTLYSFVRGVEGSRRWFAVAVACALAGAACKEVIVTAPVVLLLFDRTFVSGSFGEAWRRHRLVYLGLAASWILLAIELGGITRRGVGLGLGITPWAYAVQETGVLWRYLGLGTWPAPLTLDYGLSLEITAPEAIAGAAGLAVLLGGAVMLCRHGRRWPVLVVIALILLAPTSSVVPVAGQPMAEHRMYLPLAALVTLLVVAAVRAVGRRAGIALAMVAVAFAGITAARNGEYRDPLRLWRETVAESPANPRAWNNLGLVEAEHGDIAAAIVHYRRALQLVPKYFDAELNLGSALMLAGQSDDAVAANRRAVALAPDNAAAHANLGSALLQAGHIDEAIREDESAVQLNPRLPLLHVNLATALTRAGRLDAAIESGERAVSLDPRDANARYNLALNLLRAGRIAAAIQSADAAVTLDPTHADAQSTLGIALAQAGRTTDALAHLQQAAALKPRDAGVQENLGHLLLQTGRLPDAIAAYRRAVELSPGNADFHCDLAAARLRGGDLAGARAEYRAALQLDPNNRRAAAALARLDVAP